MNSLGALNTLNQISGLVTALRGGMAAESAYLSIAEYAADGDHSFMAVSEQLTHAACGSGQDALSTATVASALESVLPDLERAALPERPEATFVVRQMGEDLRQLQGRPNGLGPTPGVFRPSALDLLKRLNAAVSHQTLNPIQIAAMNLQMLEESLAQSIDGQTMEQIRMAREGVTRAGRFVQDLSTITNFTISEEAAASHGELMARIEALFHWTPGIAQPSAVPSPAQHETIFTGAVLYIEDDADILDPMIFMLKDRGFANIHGVESANAALEVFEEIGDIGLVVSDYRLPGGMDGVDLMRRFHEKRPALPVIFVTGSPTEVKERLTEDEKKNVLVLTKPVDISHLVTTMQRTLKTS